MPACLYYIMGLPDFHCTYQYIIAVSLKHFTLYHSADVKPVSNAQAHAMPCRYIFAISMCILQSQCMHPNLIFAGKAVV